MLNPNQLDKLFTNLHEIGNLPESDDSHTANTPIENAIIIAAGNDSGIFPFSFEKPKGLLKVKGEILIERQIAQLQEGGVERIVIVTGRMREQYFYLERKFGVRLMTDAAFQKEIEQASESNRFFLADGDAYVLDAGEYYAANPFLQPSETDESQVERFDSLADLCDFDPSFILNLDPRILDNVCKTLGCEAKDVTGFAPIGTGMTNLTFRFFVDEEPYVYRHPGNGTESVVNRAAEDQAIRIAHEIGLNDAYINSNPDQGWMISRYLPDCDSFDYSNQTHVETALQTIRTLHQNSRSIPYSFDPYDDALKLLGILRSEGYPLPKDFPEMEKTASELAERFRAECGEPVLCHNDFYAPNILIHESGIDIIDWEYAAMSDYANEIGNFVSQGSGYSIEQAQAILPFYFGREATFAEMRHCMAAIGIVGFQWYVWALFKEMKGQSVGNWLHTYYLAANRFGPFALALYE